MKYLFQSHSVHQSPPAFLQQPTNLFWHIFTQNSKSRLMDKKWKQNKSKWLLTLSVHYCKKTSSVHLNCRSHESDHELKHDFCIDVSVYMWQLIWGILCYICLTPPNKKKNKVYLLVLLKFSWLTRPVVLKVWFPDQQASASPGKMLEMQILGSHPTPTVSDWGPAICFWFCFLNKISKWFWCMLKFKNY